MAALALAVAGTAHAGDIQAIHGTWTGKIGNSRINACFTATDSHYFYLKHLHGIPLEHVEGEPGSWNEEAKGKATGKWQIAGVTDTQLTGEWIGPGNANRLAIRLTRLSGLAQGGDCGPAFYAPIAAADKPRYSKAKIGNLTLRIARSPLGASFVLVGSSDALRKINDYVGRWEAERVAQANFCERNGGGGWESSLTANAVLAGYLLVSDDVPDVYCGGPHTTSAHSALVFDLRTGEKVEPANWLAESAIEEPLRKLIMKKATACDRLEPSISPSLPTAKGMRFDLDYPHFHRDCNESIEIGYASLSPFLSKEGKELAQRVRLLSK
ncbi:hypothetical protein [Pseudoduganella sp. HUAS MS19]